jgi:hypothetical protein
MMNLQQIEDFAHSSALAAIDQAGAYGGVQESIDCYRDNIRDTLKDERCAEHEVHAWAIFDAAVAKLQRA